MSIQEISPSGLHTGFGTAREKQRVCPAVKKSPLKVQCKLFSKISGTRTLVKQTSTGGRVV